MRTADEGRSRRLLSRSTSRSRLQIICKYDAGLPLYTQDLLQCLLLEVGSFTLCTSLRQLKVVLGRLLRGKYFSIITIKQSWYPHKLIHSLSHTDELGLVVLDLVLQSILLAISLGQLELRIAGSLVGRAVNARGILR